MRTNLCIQGTVKGCSLHTVGDDYTPGTIWMTITGDRFNKWSVMFIAVAGNGKKRSLDNH